MRTRPLRDWLVLQPLPKSFRHAGFFSAHAFKLTARDGSVRHGKWEFQPDAGVLGISAEDFAGRADDFLSSDLRADVAKAPLRWRMVLVIGEDGDRLTDPTLLWPEKRRRIAVGTLTIDRVDARTGGADREPCHSLILIVRSTACVKIARGPCSTPIYSPNTGITTTGALIALLLSIIGYLLVTPVALH